MFTGFCILNLTRRRIARYMLPSDRNLTISDIAKSAGVSKTTVSRYLNGKYGYMSLNTRERIESIIKAANYQPNNMARSLKSQKSRLIGLVVADIESPFTSSIIKSVGDTLRNAGYNMIIVNSDNSYEKEREYIGSLLSQRVDGLIVNTTTDNNPFLIDLVNKGMPVVLADRFVKDYNFDIAYVECEQSMDAAMRHLREQGYGETFLITEPYDDISPRYLRREAFTGGLRQQGIINPGQYVSAVDLADNDSVCAVLKKILTACGDDNSPPAVVAANGTTLFHTLNAVHRMGIRMPEELGVCGYDDWGWLPGMGLASMIDTGITVLITQPHILGGNCAEMLLERMKDPKLPKKNISVPAVLVARGSTLLKK